MVFTKHVIKRFQDRITKEAPEVICFFIRNDIEKSTLLYRKDHIEKRHYNNITYVIDCSKPIQPKVVTLYINLV